MSIIPRRVAQHQEFLGGPLPMKVTFTIPRHGVPVNTTINSDVVAARRLFTGISRIGYA